MPVGIGRLHSGGRMLFGPQDYLWIAVGDGYSGTAPQDLSSLGGKVLRIDSQTGAAAPGNPFESSLVYVFGIHPVSRLLPPRYRACRNSRSPSSNGISPSGFVERYQRGQFYVGHGNGRGCGCGGRFRCRSGCGSRFWRSSRCGSGGWSGRRSRLVADHECDDRRTKERCEAESRVDWNPQRKRS